VETYSTSFTFRDFSHLVHDLHVLIEDIRLKSGFVFAEVRVWDVIETLDLTRQKAVRKRCVCE
jgi:hypothetical protein